MLSLQLIHIRCRSFFIFIFSQLCLVAKGQVVADFKADITQGCEGFKVQFTDLSNLAANDPANKWEWDFGNGTKGEQKNPSIVYFTPGKYTVKLVVTNGTGSDVETKNEYIIVNSKPVINFAASGTAGCDPFTVKFTDNSNAGSGTITKWDWDFGDGTGSSAQSPTHTYSLSGDFTVTVKVSNSVGCTNVATRDKFIHVDQVPKADFTSGSAATCKPPVQVNFSNTSSGSSISDIKWDFGDGSISSAPNPSHTYANTGTYQVTLIIKNQNGCSDTITKPTVIGSVLPGFTAPDTVCQNAPAIFVNTSTPAIASAYWDFGDNSNSSDINPVKNFSASGSFFVKLVNNFGACKDSITKRILVLPKPTADFSFVAPPSTCKVPVDISFNSQSTGVTAYLWDFGDATTSNSPGPTHTYTNYGTYSVKLTVTGANGCADMITKPGIISVLAPNIEKFIGLPHTGCVPREQKFAAQITSSEPVTSYLWDFGDGTTSTDVSPSHSYTVEGAYTVSLQIATTNGCTDTLVMRNAVRVANKPTADFSATPRAACAYESVQFTNLSKGNITSHKWEFGDGGWSNERDPLYHYRDTGSFAVRLIVSNASCVDTLTLKNYIYIKPPIARFAEAFDCKTPLVRRFRNLSVAAEKSHWTFGDGGESDEPNPMHTYASPGTYYVHLHVTNGDCYDDLIDTIQVIDEHPDFTIDQSQLCRNNTSVFTVTNIDTKNISTYAWNFSDNTPVSITTGPIINHNYLRPGVFTPSVTLTDILGCTRAVERTVSISIYGPNAAFTNPAGTCLNSQVTFTDQSQPTANHPIATWIFDYGDGVRDTTTNPVFSHAYAIPKSYDLTLIVRDSYGCSDTLFKPAAINITSPKASFSTVDSIGCKNSAISFVNRSLGLGLNYTWDFGDGSTSNAISPGHAYAAEGHYTVSLAIKDQYGCTDTLVKTNGVVAQDARASFTLSDSIISCPPAQVSFINTSTSFKAVKWDFDDGNFAAISNPSHYFLQARSYQIKLIAFGYGGCADSAVRVITVKGPSGSFTYNPAAQCVPSSISFTGTASNNNNSFTWDFGDGTATTTTTPSISHVYASPGRFLPKLLLIDTSVNCRISVFGADSITVSGALGNIKTPQNLFCDSTTLQFFDSSIVKFDAITEYSWSFGDGAISNTQNPSHSYKNPGVFPVRLKVTTAAGCTDSSDTSFIKIVKSPQVKIVAASSTCINQRVTFAGQVQPDTSSIKWSWDFGNGNVANVATPGPQNYSTSGDYPVGLVVTNSSGCIKKDSTVLTVHPLPNVDAGLDTVICRGASLILRPSGADTYLWNSRPSLSCASCANPTASPVDTTLYYVTGTNALTTCKQTDSIKVIVAQPFKVISIDPDTICVGQSVKMLAAGADYYTWSPAAGLSDVNTANPVARPDTTTIYAVTGRDKYKCFTDVAYVPVTVYPIPVFKIIDHDISVSAGSNVTLKTTSSRDITRWQWFPAAGLSCSNCAEPVAMASNTISYKAVASNDGGCTAEDRVTVQVFCNNGNIFIPNTFSPNNDGSNDIFFPRGRGIAGVKYLRIFNRWGTVVFEKSNFAVNDPGSGWNGMYNGKRLDADVFVYQAEVICETGQVFSLRGDITLIR